MANALPAIWLKKRILDGNGVFLRWNIRAVPGEWEKQDNPTTPSKLQLDFLDPRAGWERATDEDIAQEKTRLANLENSARAQQLDRRVNEVMAQEVAVQTVMEKVKAKREAAASPAPKTNKP